jgi:hypothetical protein
MADWEPSWRAEADWLLPAGRGRAAGGLGLSQCRVPAWARGALGSWPPGKAGRLGRLGVAAGVVGWATGTAGKGRE